MPTKPPDDLLLQPSRSAQSMHACSQVLFVASLMGSAGGLCAGWRVMVSSGTDCSNAGADTHRATTRLVAVQTRSISMA